MKAKSLRVAAAVAALAGSALALPALAAVEGDSTSVRALGASGFSPATTALPEQCRSLPVVTRSYACPSGTTGTIQTQSYYYCPAGSEPGLYSPATVTSYGCVSNPIQAPETAPSVAPPPPPPVVVSAACVNRTHSYTLRRTGTNTFEGREVTATSDTGWVAFTAGRYYPNLPPSTTPDKVIGRGQFRVSAATFAVLTRLQVVGGLAQEDVMCFSTTP